MMHEFSLPVIVGENIAKRRKQLGLSQKEVALSLSITQEALGRMEKGKIAPKMTRLEDIAKHLQCSVAFLFQRPSDSTKERSAMIAELIEPLASREQELVMDFVASTVTVLQGKKNVL